VLHDKRYLTLLLVHLHGLAMVSWIALFVTQTLLVAKHRGICIACSAYSAWS
jgi:hypothetical protein